MKTRFGSHFEPLIRGRAQYGGTLELNTEGQAYREMFDFMTVEENFGMDPPVDDPLMEGWSVEEPDGKRETIGAPAVHDGSEIYFSDFSYHGPPLMQLSIRTAETLSREDKSSEPLPIGFARRATAFCGPL